MGVFIFRFSAIKAILAKQPYQAIFLQELALCDR